MSLLFRVLALSVVVLVCLRESPHEAASQVPGPADQAFVHNGFVRVIDGDTVEIWRDDRRWGIGLIGIEAPQANTACGMSATARMWELTAQGAKFHAETDFPNEKYRLMYKADTLEDVSIEATLVAEGLAKVAQDAGKEGARLRVLEADAKRENRGCVWGGKKGPPPVKRKFPPRTEPAFAAAVQGSGETAGVSAAAISVPGFQDRLVKGGFSEPTTFEFAPDGRILVAEKAGVIRLVKNGQLLPTPLLNISSRVNAYWDHGLIGLTVDPNFASNGFIYVVYTYENDPIDFDGRKTARLSRFTVVGDVASPSSELVLVGKVVGDTCNDFPAGTDCIPSDGASHSVGNVRFGIDGKLYATFGDAASFVQVDDDALRAQDPVWLSGKVIRVNPDGTGVPDNPFWNGSASSNRSKVWAVGVRNAFRFNFEPERGTMYLGDVGWNEREEITVVRRGSNLGWPCYEGISQQAGYASKQVCQSLYGQGTGAITAPIVDWAHNEGGCCGAAAVGGAFTTSYTGAFEDAYFYADYSKNWIRYFKVDVNDNLVGSPEAFLTGGNGPVSVQRGTSGDIYYLAINTGEIRHIQQGSGNQPPVAVMSASATDGLAPLNVNFSAEGSSDPNVDPLTFEWDFGDGQGGTGFTAAHQYTVNGTYTVTLTVRDSLGLTDTAETTVVVGNRRPVVSIASPLHESTYVVGETITLEGSATDLDDGGALPASSLEWRITLFHNTHTHPFLTITHTQPTPPTFVIPDHGDNTYVVVELDAVDSSGLHGVSSVTIRPQTVLFTLNTSPPGLDLVYDGVLVQSPYTAVTVANSSHTIEAPSPQGTATFSSWSDGGAQQHVVTLGLTNESRTATFLGAAVINFNDLGSPGRNFSGQYPSGVANWPSGAWYLSGPWGALTTNSVSFQTASQSSGSFSFLSPQVLLSARVYNGGGASSTVTLACSGNPTRSQVVAVGQVLLVNTNWTVPCTTITLTSTNGWNTNFDDFVYQSQTAPPDTTPPLISAVQATSVSSVGATITWTTNEASSTQVEYGTTASYGSSAPTTPNTTPVTAHSQGLTGLTPGTLYHYRVKSSDASGNLATSTDFTFTTSAPDTTAPLISAVQATSITTTGATITWTTNEASSTQVEYGTTTSYGSSAPTTPNTSPVTAHSQGLTGLSPNTLYHYRVKSADAAGNLATSGDFTFTTAADTTAPTISAVQASGVTQTAATITWTTSEGATTQVEYGLTTSYGLLAPAVAGPGLVTSHSQALAGLTAGTLYHYRVHSVDAAGNAAVSGDFTFTTQSTSINFNDLGSPGRNFSGEYPSGVANWPSSTWYLSGPWGALTTNSVSFQTAGQSSGSFSFLAPQVLLSARIYNGGGASSTVTLACTGNPTRSQAVSAGQVLVLNTTWTVPCTTITLTSSNGWNTNFDDFVYQSQTAPPDTTPPLISAVQATSVSSVGATITWTTNEASSTQVEYGTTTSYGSSAPTTPNTTPLTAHSQGLTGLTPGTLYHYRVKSSDAAGNLATSADFTFTTTAPDTTAPIISAVQSTSITQASATITWTTNEASSTQVEYGTTTGYGSLAPVSPNTTPVTAHSQGLTGLSPNTLYHYRVKSADASGNLATSGDFTFTTAADTTAPTISAVQSGSVTQTAATITWLTNETSTTQVEYGTTASYGSFAPVVADPALVVSHSQPLSGLTAGTLYHYRVHSIDAAGNAAVSGDFTFTTQSTAGGAWQFDGSNDRATASDSNSLDLTGPLTLEAWVKFDSVQPGKWHTIIFKQGLSNNLGYALYYRNGLWFEIRSGTGYIVLQDKLPLQTGVWYHIAAVYDRVTMRTYVNGQQTASLPFTGAVATSTFDLTLGYNNVWSNEQFTGTIDEVRISKVSRYSSNFTPAGAFTTDADTVALWHFDEGTGQTTADASGNGNTLRRGATTSAESTDPAWVVGAPLALLGLAELHRRRGRRE